MSAAAAASSHAVPIAASATPPGGCGCSAQTHDAAEGRSNNVASAASRQLLGPRPDAATPVQRAFAAHAGR